MTLSSTTAPASSTSNAAKPLDVVFIVDVTGSMGSEIDGVKRMIHDFCATERPGVRIHIYTFTENSKGCYVSTSPSNLSNAELARYVDRINLNESVDFPGISACGDDGPENVVAGVAQLTLDFNNSDNVLAFIITDAPPHHKCFGTGSTQRMEAQWLAAKGFQNTDIFQILNEVTEAINCTLVPILYNVESQAKWYQQAAFLTGGLCLVPTTRTSSLLSQGLTHILSTMQQLATTRQTSASIAQTTAANLRGFNILPIDPDFVLVEQDPDSVAGIQPTSTTTHAIGSEAIFSLLTTTVDRFSGKKALKRVRLVKSTVVMESVKVMLMSVLRGLGKTEIFNQELFDACVASLREIFAFSEGDDDINKIDRLLLEKLVKGDGFICFDAQDDKMEVDGEESSGMTCVITLDSVTEYITGLSSLPETPRTEAELMPWMNVVMEMCMVRLLNIKFPLDALGKTDFNDSWSSRINDVSTASVLSGSSAMQLRLDSGMETFLDPLSRKEYTSACIVAHPNDPILTYVYKTLTCLPSLHGLIQGYLVSGGMKVFPSLGPGIQASSLFFHLNNPDIEVIGGESNLKMAPALWEVMRTMIWSLRQSSTPTAITLVRSIRDGKGLNPADAFSKLLAAVIIHMNQMKNTLTKQEKAKLLINLYEEVSAGAVATFHDANEKLIREGGHANHSRHVAPLKLANCFVELSELGDAFFDPISALHPAEKFLRKQVGVSVDFKNRVKELVGKSKLCVKTIDLMKKIGCVLQADVKKGDPELAFSEGDLVFVEEDKLVEIMVESMLVGRRTGRYTLDDTVTPAVWVRNKDAVDVEAAGHILVAEVYRTMMKDWNQARQDFCHKDIIKVFVVLVKALTHQEVTVDYVSARIAKISVELHGKEYTLSRMDAMEMLSYVPKPLLSTVGVAVVTGDWSTEPPCNLRRSLGELEKVFYGQDEATLAIIRDAVGKKAVASRAVANRHGHSIMLQYPGIYGWTLEYQDARLATGKKNLIRKLATMHEFTKLREEAIMKVGEGNAEKLKELMDILNAFDDVNQLAVGGFLATLVQGTSPIESVLYCGNNASLTPNGFPDFDLNDPQYIYGTGVKDGKSVNFYTRFLTGNLETYPGVPAVAIDHPCEYWFGPTNTTNSIVQDSTFSSPPINGWFSFLTTGIIKNSTLETTPNWFQLEIQQFMQLQQNTWAIVGARTDRLLSILGTRQKQDAVPVQNGVAISTASTPFSVRTGGILGSIDARYFLNLTNSPDMSQLFLQDVQQVPYYIQPANGIKSPIDFDDIITEYITNALMVLAGVDKTILQQPNTTPLQISHYYASLAVANSMIPAGAIFLDDFEAQSLMARFVLQYGNDARIVVASNFQPAGHRLIAQVTQLSQALLRAFATIEQNPPSSNLANATITQGLKAFPQTISTKLELAFGGMIGKFLYPFGISFLLPMFVIVLVKEKEDKIYIQMEINGMKPIAYYFSHYLTFFALYSISTLCFVISGFVAQLEMFTITDPVVLLLLFFLWGNTQIVLSFFFASLFNKSRTALVMVFLVVICSVIISLSIDTVFLNSSSPVSLFLWPPFAFYRALLVINRCSFNKNVMPYHRSRLGLGDEVFLALMFLVLDIFLYSFVAVYLYNVLPKDYGTRKPFYYPVASAWKFFNMHSSGIWNPLKAYTDAEEFNLHEADDFEDHDVKQERAIIQSGQVPATAKLIVNDLRKSFLAKNRTDKGKGAARFYAVDKVSLFAEAGSVFGLLGQNGAGKSTLLGLLTGVVEVESGNAVLDGAELRGQLEEVYKKIGVCPQFDILWRDLTVCDHLLFYARLKGATGARLHNIVTEAIQLADLVPSTHVQIKNLSGGQKRRVSIAIALLGNPQVIFLDEPTTGLDPEVRRLIWTIIQRTAKESNAAVVLITHSMEECEALCSKVGIIADGKLRCLANPLRLKELYGSGYRLFFNALERDVERICAWIESLLPTGYKKLGCFATK
ncbi:UNVERIFIED_CONTAM: hypothetical protein HDU68_010479 [Siphonaria sp. JEL0065]|nr:hypothetical protein HDU68_010479 [Siphonaria sp. JEL0065]